jgi:hypothetical protein
MFTQCNLVIDLVAEGCMQVVSGSIHFGVINCCCILEDDQAKRDEEEVCVAASLVMLLIDKKQRKKESKTEGRDSVHMMLS